MKNASFSNAMAYSVDEVVGLTKISRATLYQKMKSGNLRFKKLGRRTLVLHDDLTSFLKSLDDGNMRPTAQTQSAISKKH